MNFKNIAVLIVITASFVNTCKNYKISKVKKLKNNEIIYPLESLNTLLTYDKNILKKTVKNYYPKNKKLSVIHMFLCLCDEENQSIDCGPSFVGRGDDAARNLYWGLAPNGFKTFFINNVKWQLIYQRKKINKKIIERLIFKRPGKNIYLVADAYYGDKIYNAVEDFILAAGKNNKSNVKIKYANGRIFELPSGGNSDFVIYAGHNGLFHYDNLLKVLNKRNVILKTKRFKKSISAAVIACHSKYLFLPVLRKIDAYPFLLTKLTVAPEGYIIDSVINSWIKRQSKTEILNNAVNIYKRYHYLMPLDEVKKIFYVGW